MQTFTLTQLKFEGVIYLPYTRLLSTAEPLAG